MRTVCLLLMSLISASVAEAQVLEFAPFNRSSTSSRVESSDFNLIGSQINGFRNTAICPPEIKGYAVASGDSIFVTVDTFGLGRGESAVLTLINSPVLKYGTAVLNGIKLTYKANAGFNGLAEEKIQVQYEEKGRKETISITIKITRKGQQVIADSRTVLPESITKYCLDNELNFHSNKACGQLLGTSDSYDGKGQQSFHFSSYAFPDTCIVYYASRFPGRDTVNVRICDELAVCDTFKIPFLIRGDTLRSLPFFDDFSAYRGPLPSGKYWLDKNVYVNNSLAPNPPTIGFATFDGLDRRGNPYQLSSGPGDLLTSIPIDLSSYNAGSDVVLKFYLAPKGYGLAPEVNDSLKVEFRNNEGKWIQMSSYKGLNNVSLDSFPAFIFRSIKVAESQFFHKAFQFRFTAYTSPGGAVDLWHLDYVRLAANEGISNSFPDVAFTQPASSILKNYTSMPWWQFRGFEDKEMQDKLKSSFYNHFDFQTALGSSTVSFRETTTGTDFNQSFTVVETGQDNNMPVKTHILRNRTIPAANFNGIKLALTNIPNADFRNLETRYLFTVTAQPKEYQVNDTVTLNTSFSNYFAHDDGSGEWQVFVKFAKGGEMMASRFHTNVADTLRAVQFMFPHVAGDVQDQQFKIKIWTADPSSSKPAYESHILKPFYADNVLDTIQGFTTYRLESIFGKETPLFIPAGEFWVAWEQVSAASLGVPVGFDLHNHCDCNYSNINGLWKAFPSNLKGSLMVRPVFGMKAPKNTVNQASNNPRPANEVVNIFPNPNAGTVYFNVLVGNPIDYRVMVVNNLGQIILETPMPQEINLPFAADGLYLIKIQNIRSGEIYHQKLLVSANKNR